MRNNAGLSLRYDATAAAELSRVADELQVAPEVAANIAVAALSFMVGEMRRGAIIQVVNPDAITRHIDLGLPNYDPDLSFDSTPVTIEDMFGTDQ